MDIRRSGLVEHVSPFSINFRSQPILDFLHKLGGQFAAKKGGQFQTKSGGQFRRNLQYYPILKILNLTTPQRQALKRYASGCDTLQYSTLTRI